MNIITKIEVQKKNKERVNIYIDNEYSFSLSAELVYKENLKINEKVDIEKITFISKEDNYIKCKNTALRIIERTYKSEKELKDKLLLKGYDHLTIDKTIDFLREYNLLNDTSYVKMYVKDKSKLQGKKKIKYDLIKKGISDNLIEKEISNIDEENEKEIAYNMVLKKYNILSKRETDKYKLSQKLYRFLLSKGYDHDVVSNVVKRVMNTEEIY